jgi:hypothetical protein
MFFYLPMILFLDHCFRTVLHFVRNEPALGEVDFVAHKLTLIHAILTLTQFKITMCHSLSVF